MSAQKELAELIANGAPHPAEFYVYVNFLRDHGPAIAELIRLAKFSLPYLPDGDECCGLPEWSGSTDHPPECCGKPINPRTEMTELVRKLTEPKA